MDGLSDEQRACLDAFVNLHHAFTAAMERRVDDLRARRLEALQAAFEAGVPGTVLARAAGLTHGRVYQLRDEASRGGRDE